jgi:hypothetical protein
MPSTRPQFAPPEFVEPEQVPATCPEAMLQRPVQQSVLCVQISPAWPHHDDGWHVPPAHRDEQQSLSCMHALPSVKHVVDSAVHVPLQVMLQHCEPPVHG